MIDTSRVQPTGRGKKSGIFRFDVRQYFVPLVGTLRRRCGGTEVDISARKIFRLWFFLYPFGYNFRCTRNLTALTSFYKKNSTPQRLGTFSAIFLRVAEKSQVRAFFARSTYQR